MRYRCASLRGDMTRPEREDQRNDESQRDCVYGTHPETFFGGLLHETAHSRHQFLGLKGLDDIVGSAGIERAHDVLLL